MRLLIIDDEKDILDILAEIIETEKLGVFILKASNVMMAKNLIPHCDAIISDVNMPDKSKLEQLILDSEKPVIRITGHDDFDSKKFIKKPFDTQDIVDAIKFLSEKLEG